jgi:apolipoprotein N-acyltransferase
LQWLRSADSLRFHPRSYLAWAVLAAYAAGLVLAAVLLLRRRDRGRPWPLRVLAVLASMAVVALVHLLGLTWLGWVALVPLWWLARSPDRPGPVVALVALAGLATLGLVLRWPPLADLLRFDCPMHGTWVMLSVWCSLFVVSAVLLLRLLDRATPLPLVVTLPTVWVVLEYFRSFLLTGFSWYYLGHTQHEFLALIQVTDLGGAYTVSLLVAAVNAWCFEALARRGWFRSFFGLPDRPAPRGLAVQAVVVGVLVNVAVLYGLWRLGQEGAGDGPRVALLQGSIDQRLRNQATADVEGAHQARRTILAHYGQLCLDAAAARPRPDLIVWPETSFPFNWLQLDDSVAAGRADPRDLKFVSDCRDYALAVGVRCKTDVLLGLNVEELGLRDPGRAAGRQPLRPVRRYCSALLVRPDGREAGRYDKIVRVPFGEYVPLRDVLPFMDLFAPYDYDYSIQPGKRFTRFALAKTHFGVLICNEDTNPFLARRYALADADGPAVDFLVNISNEGWFDDSSEHEEHLAAARFRAVECRRPMVRAVNMGISAVIDGNGRVLRPREEGGTKDVPFWQVGGGPVESLPAAEWGEYKQVQGVLTAVLPLDGRTSLYALWGDWLPLACGAVAAAGLVLGRRRPEGATA